jgi:predicted transport protein
MVMGTNKLSKDLIEIDTKDISIKLNFKDNQLIQSFKNSMGYSYFVPNLPCYHSVLNASHVVSGEISYDGGQYSLVNEMGYLEKNWGTSFPENYFWLHAIDPENPQISLLFSRAEIKWLGKTFIRHVGHFRIDGMEIDLRELRNISTITFDQNTEIQTIRIESKSLKLYISINIGKNVILKGPTNGELSRDIIHHIDAVIDVKMIIENKIRQFKMVGNFEQIDAFC